MLFGNKCRKASLVIISSAEPINTNFGYGYFFKIEVQCSLTQNVQRLMIINLKS